MDDIALDSDLTQVDRADRARRAWAAYEAEHGGRVQDLITDLLHMVEVDETEEGALGTALSAAHNFESERPAWPEETATYAGQVRREPYPWLTEGTATTPREAAGQLRKAMELVGFYTSEMHAHMDDLIKGHVLTADDGHQFRVIAIKVTDGGE